MKYDAINDKMYNLCANFYVFRWANFQNGDQNAKKRRRIS